MTDIMDIRRKIRWLNKSDVRRLNYEQLVTIYHKLVDGLAVLIEVSPSTEMFFRARLNPVDRPNNVKDLGSPPAEVIQGYQRCNPPRCPMFYASSRRSAALLECSVSVGDTAYLSQWMPKEPFPINAIVHAISDDDHPVLNSPTQILMQSWIETLFTRRIDREFSEDYKHTAALAQVLTRRFEASGGQKIREDGLVAIRYPSIVDIEGAHNTAFHPVFALERLELLHVMELTITAVSRSHVEVSVTDNATVFSNGVIGWHGNAERVPMLRLPNGAVPFISDGKQWNLVTTEAYSSAHVAALFAE